MHLPLRVVMTENWKHSDPYCATEQSSLKLTISKV